MPFTCIDEHNQMIALDKNKTYENKLFNVLKIRGACSHRMAECFLSDGCRWLDVYKRQGISKVIVIGMREDKKVYKQAVKRIRQQKAD